jgi:hypothetical protein
LAREKPGLRQIAPEKYAGNSQKLLDLRPPAPANPRQVSFRIRLQGLRSQVSAESHGLDWLRKVCQHKRKRQAGGEMCGDRSAAHSEIHRMVRKNKQAYIGQAPVLVFGLTTSVDRRGTNPYLLPRRLLKYGHANHFFHA